jgi:hypothetical protein
VDRYEFRKIARFSESFDTLWESVKESRPLAVVKDSAFLNWRYLRCPERRHECWAIYENDHLQGWVVFRTRHKYREGCLLDLIARNNDPKLIKAMVYWTLERLKADHVGLVRASFPSASPEGKVLQQIGFHSWTTSIARIELVVTIPRHKQLAGKFALKLEACHFTLGDWLYF